MDTAAARVSADDAVWRLAKASKYKSNHDGDFSPRSPVSRHMFGWDRKNTRFVFESDFGGALRPSRQIMPMPVELAEKFLLRCRAGDFNRRMLAAVCGTSEPAKETIEHGIYGLEITRTRDTGVPHPPSLLLTLRGRQPVVGFVLFSEMRVKLGKTVAEVPERTLREYLRA